MQKVYQNGGGNSGCGTEQTQPNYSAGPSADEVDWKWFFICEFFNIFIIFQLIFYTNIQCLINKNFIENGKIILDLNH